MKARDGSIAMRAIELIRARGALRSTFLAQELGVLPAVIAPSLSPYVKDGTLVMCKVERTESHGGPQNEYRCSASGPMSKSMRDYEAARARATLGRERQPIRRPTIDASSRLLLDDAAARARESAAPALPAGDAEPQPDKITVPAPTIDWGTVVEGPFGPIEPKKISQEVLHPMNAESAPACRPFRCALASDGSLILFLPTLSDPVDLCAAHARELVEYLRKLDQIPPARLDLAQADTPALLAPQVC